MGWFPPPSLVDCFFWLLFISFGILSSLPLFSLLCPAIPSFLTFPLSFPYPSASSSFHLSFLLFTFPLTFHLPVFTLFIMVFDADASLPLLVVFQCCDGSVP